MYEEAAGCYGALSTPQTEIQLWVDVDTCGEREYKDKEQATVEITFNPDNQYGAGKTYAITSFK